MQNFQDTFETRKRSFISAFSICMTAPLNLSENSFQTALNVIRQPTIVIALQIKLSAVF